jgi:membrane protein
MFTLKLDIYDKIKGFLIGLFIGIMGWLPFIILYKDILYPIKFMMHMLKVNQIISMAVNPWFCMQILFRSSDNIILRYGFVFIIFIIVSLIFIYIKTKDIVLSTYMYMLFLFMFSLGQRERYILYSIIILYYLIYNLNQTQYIKLYKAFNISAIISLSYFLINTVLPEDIAYASIYLILPIYFVLAIWLLIQTANTINLIFNKSS